VSIIFSGLGLTKKSDRLSTASPDETLSWPVKLDGLRTSSGAPKSINSKVIIGRMMVVILPCGATGWRGKKKDDSMLQA
jgi:hypothetical protein